MLTRLISYFALCCLAALAVFAQDTSEIRRRMEQRLPAIDGMKARQIVGENNRGFLEERSRASDDERQTISAENGDRQAVYNAIARQTGASADEVGRARAKKIAAGSAPGVWLQRENGEWYRK